MQDLSKNDNPTDFLKAQRNKAIDKMTKFAKQGSSRKMLIKKGERIILKVPLTVGIGGATAAIFVNAPVTALAALLALSNDVSISFQNEHENKHST